MARLDLKKVAGFSIGFEGSNLISEDFTVSSKKDFFIKEVFQQLLNSEVNSPDYFYTKFLQLDQDNVFSNKGICVNLVLLMPNLAGIEFVKTLTDVSSNSHRILDFLYGGGIVIQQEFATNDMGNIYTSSAKKGSKVLIHSGYDYAVSNTKNTPLIFLEITKKDSDSNNLLDDMHGLAYYVIRKNAKQEIVRNPEYRQVNPAKKVNFDKLLIKLGITLKTPIIKQILRKYEKFAWFFNNTPINF